jgi:hypothetical protein
MCAPLLSTLECRAILPLARRLRLGDEAAGATSHCDDNADCVPCLFRQMGARHGDGPGRRIQRGRSGGITAVQGYVGR